MLAAMARISCSPSSAARDFHQPLFGAVTPLFIRRHLQNGQGVLHVRVLGLHFRDFRKDSLLPFFDGHVVTPKAVSISDRAPSYSAFFFSASSSGVRISRTIPVEFAVTVGIADSHGTVCGLIRGGRFRFRIGTP